MPNIKRLYNIKFNLYLLLGIALLNAVIVGLSVWKFTYRFNFTYLKFNVVQLAVIFITCAILFYTTYKKAVKKNPDILMIISYLLAFLLFAYSAINLNILIERTLNKGIFSVSNGLFINIILICFGIILSNFDLPSVDSLKKGYFSIKENVYKYLGIILVVVFITGFIGLKNTTFVYILSLIPISLNLYLLKVWLSNLRK